MHRWYYVLGKDLLILRKFAGTDKCFYSTLLSTALIKITHLYVNLQRLMHKHVMFKHTSEHKSASPL